MSRMVVNVKRNRDGTVTVRVGRAVEHFSTDGKTKGQVFDAVKWAVISKGAHLDDVTLTEMLFDPVVGH